MSAVTAGNRYDLYVEGERLGVVEVDLPKVEIEERLGPNCHVIEHEGELYEPRMVSADGRHRTAEIVKLGAGCGYSRLIHMPLQFFDCQGFEPRKPWVRDKDWEQRAPRRRRRR